MSGAALLPGIWAEDRAEHLAHAPRVGLLLHQWQQAHELRRPSQLDVVPAGTDVEALPPFAGTLTLTLAEPGQRVDHYVQRFARAHTALSLALEQRQTAILPTVRSAAWRRQLWSRHTPALARARGLADELGWSSRFDGALCFDGRGAAQAVRLWFWAERTGVFGLGLLAVWQWPHALIGLRLCAHGNLHAEVYGAWALKALRAAARPCGWEEVPGPCLSGWQAPGHKAAIPGRQLIV